MIDDTDELGESADIGYKEFDPAGFDIRTGEDDGLGGEKETQTDDFFYADKDDE